MATPKLDALSKALSIKIFDPVSSGLDDGRVYTSELRLSYINRAFGNMVRTLEVLSPKITKVFKDYFVLVDVPVGGMVTSTVYSGDYKGTFTPTASMEYPVIATTTNDYVKVSGLTMPYEITTGPDANLVVDNGLIYQYVTAESQWRVDTVSWNATGAITYTNEWPMDGAYNIYDLYFKPTQGGDWVRGEYIDPDNYLVAKNGVNEFYVPDTNSRKWTVIDSSVLMLPVPSDSIEYHGLQILARNYWPEFVHSSDRDLFLPGDYYDILVTMAAIEAMADKGETAKYTLYTKSLNSQLEVIAMSKKQADVTEEGQK